MLFVGNSLTPGTVAQLAASVNDTVRVKSVALPDYALIDHMNGGSNAVDVIRGEPWNMGSRRRQ
ncbi:MAG: hypothetical protein ABIY52_05455 [Gemmatimonadaceae bacterium]